MPRQNAIAKAGRESLNLGFDAARHVHLRIVRHVTITPSGVLTRRRASLIEQALLRKQYKRAFGVSSLSNNAFAFGNFLCGAANVHGCSLQALARFPRNW